MYDPPAQPKIYHITHVGNLPNIIGKGWLVSDALMAAEGGPSAPIGMAGIKQRRRTLPVHCHRNTYVGDYVPFYFCPRSIMLYIIHKANNPELGYTGGQGPIVHLEADMAATIEWANTNRQQWAFSLSNASATYTQFRSDLARLNEINWLAVEARNFTARDIKEGKQAEFLLHKYFPWQLVSRIGVFSRQIAQQAHNALGSAGHRPPIEIVSDWYF